MYKFRWTFGREAGRAVAVQTVTPAVIDVPAGGRAHPFELTIPDAALQAALKAAVRRGGR